MTVPVPIPVDQQKAVAEISAGELSQMKARATTFAALEKDTASLRLQIAQAERLRLLVENESGNYIGGILSKYVDTTQGHSFRVDPESGQIYQTGVHESHEVPEQHRYMENRGHGQGEQTEEGNRCLLKSCGLRESDPIHLITVTEDTE